CSQWWNQTLPTLNGNVSWTNSTNVSMQIPTILLRGWKLLPTSRGSFQTKQTEIVDEIRPLRSLRITGRYRRETFNAGGRNTRSICAPFVRLTSLFVLLGVIP